MRPFIQFAVLLALVALVAAGGCFLTGRYFKAKQPDGSPCTHAAVHARLNLTDDQERKLEPIEARFTEKRRHYGELIRMANVELADAILADKADSPRVQAAVGQIHAAMGDLQKATLDHVFEMKEVLTPEQYDKLLRLTADGLRCQP